MTKVLIAISCITMTFAVMAEDSSGGMMSPPSTGCLATNDAARARSAVMYINHLNHVVAKLKDMNNLILLQQEYENLTDDNLNLESIQDETTVQLIVQLMDALKGLQSEAAESVKAQVVLEAEKDGAIWKALPQPSVLLVAKDPYTLAIAIGGAALTSIQNYYNAVSEAEKKHTEKKFTIAKEKLAYINEINKELFISQWRLMRDYRIADRERVTREDSRMFLGFSEVLKDAGNDYNRNKLVHNIFVSHEREMRNLPFYWITRASAALALKDDKDVRISCEEYFKLYKDTPIVRKDMDACAMALLYVSTVLAGHSKINNEQRSDIYAWLRFIEETVRIPEWQTKFAVAMIYKQMGDEKNCKRLLQSSLDEVYACVLVWEQSKETENIFRKTPALQKAYGDVNFMTNWANWKEETKALVPYKGYFWLAGALYEMGESKVFLDRPCNEKLFKVEKQYVTGEHLKHLPKVREDSGLIQVVSNVRWAKEEDINVFIDKTKCTKTNGGYQIPRHCNGENIIIYYRTPMGVNVKYTFLRSDLEKSPEVEIGYPWS